MFASKAKCLIYDMIFVSKDWVYLETIIGSMMNSALNLKISVTFLIFKEIWLSLNS